MLCGGVRGRRMFCGAPTTLPHVRSRSDTQSAAPCEAVGVAYLVIITVSMLYAWLVETRLVVAGDDAATAANILNEQGLFRAGIV